MAFKALHKDIPFQFQSRLEPPSQERRTRGTGGGVKSGERALHRYMLDAVNKTYFGFDLSVERVSDAATLRVSILPLSVGPKELDFEEPSTWQPLRQPRFPEPQQVRLGDTIAFDLFVNPTTGQRLVEYVLIGRDHRMETATGPTREFTVHEVEIVLRAPRFTRNGERLGDESERSGLIRGHFVILYLPPNGRFVLSLTPHPERGFAKAGEIRGSTLTFEAGGAEYRVNCEGKIAPGRAAYDLYVRHDPAYRPGGGADGQFFFGGSDAFEGSR
jgi:hypothetical protein